MSEAVGPVAVLAGEEPSLLGQATGAVSERTRELVDAEVRRIVEESEEAALVLLRERRPQLEALARALLEHETLDEAEAYRAAGIPHEARPRAPELPSSLAGTPPSAGPARLGLSASAPPDPAGHDRCGALGRYLFSGARRRAGLLGELDAAAKVLDPRLEEVPREA
jgi:hypothetical protein